MATYLFYLRRSALIVVFVVAVIALSFSHKWLNPLIHSTFSSQTSVGSARSKRSTGGEYLIDTATCKIPRTDIVNNEIEKLMDISDFEKFPKPHCHYVKNKYKPSLVAANQTALYVLKGAKKYYTKTNNGRFRCSYTPFWKAWPDNMQTHRKFGKKTYFIDSVAVPSTTEFVQVICTFDFVKVYEDCIAFVPEKNASTAVSTQDKPNVLIFGLDSLSRGNFYRQMPQTASTLQRLDFIEYLGYTKVGENTFPNLMPFLTNYTHLELQSVCWFNMSTYFDECPFIWQKYKSQGYATAFIEEQSWISLFTYAGKKGFINPPTDYYYHPFDRAASETIGRKYFDLTNFCFGPKQSIDVFLDYSSRLISTLKNKPLFGFFFGSTISHDYLNLPRLSDSKFKNLFTLMESTKLTDNSIIIFMGDHGLRFGYILNTKEGYMEARMPLFTVFFPKWFSQKYPLAYANFKANSKRLTTHFDAHETLNDLTDLTTITDSNIRQRTSQLDQLARKPRGISLFLPIPETRTCTQAGIPSIYCTCITTKTAAQDGPSGKEMAEFVVRQINKRMSKFPECAQLSLDSVVDVEYLLINDEDLIRVTVQTKPGGGNFEAMIKVTNKAYVKNLMELSDGTILRINQYETQKSCNVDEKEKLYCHCK